METSKFSEGRMGISNDIAPKKTFHHPIEHRNVSDSETEKTEPDFGIDVQIETPEQTKIEIQETVQEPEAENNTKNEKVTSEESNIIPGDSFFPENKSSKKNVNDAKKIINQKRINPIWFLWALFLILLIILVSQNFNNIKKIIFKDNTPKTEAPKTQDTTLDDTYTSESTTTNNANIGIQESTPSDTETTTPTTPAATTTTDKSTIKISVLNGNGVTNSANVIEKTLEDNGFTVSNTANAKRFTYTQTYIYYKTGKDAEANLIKDALSKRSVVMEKSDSTAGKYDCVVVVGKK